MYSTLSARCLLLENILNPAEWEWNIRGYKTSLGFILIFNYNTKYLKRILTSFGLRATHNGQSISNLAKNHFLL